MKLLIIIDSLGSGGAERSTAVLSKYLKKEDIQFDILCLDRKEVGVQQEMQENGFNIYFIRKANFLSEVKQITEFIKANSYDLVHSILFRANIRTRFAKLHTKFVHVESLVNTTYSRERFQDKNVNQIGLKFYKFLDAKTASRWVDHFHSITLTVKEHYVEELGLDPAHITVIPRGRKPILKDYEDRPKKSDERIKLINIGRQEYQKGQIHLLKAAKVLKEKGYNFHLTFLGRDGSVTPILKEYVEENGLNEVITFEGFKNNVDEYLKRADLFVFPSLFEGLGGALIEAQGAGLPIACNDIPVLHEVVRADENAKFFDVHNTSSIVEAISFFIEHADQREQYGRNSLRNFKEKFMESRNNRELIKLYNTLC